MPSVSGMKTNSLQGVRHAVLGTLYSRAHQIGLEGASCLLEDFHVEFSPGRQAESPTIDMAELKKNWILSPEAFRRLLHWLDAGGDSGGERYLEMRRRLTAYFDRKNC